MSNKQERYPGYNENNLTDVSTNEMDNVRYKLANNKKEEESSFCSVCTEETKKECPFCNKVNVSNVVISNVVKASHEKEILDIVRKDIRKEVKPIIVDLSQIKVQNVKPNTVEQYGDEMDIEIGGGGHKVQVITSDNSTINPDADVVIIFNNKSGIVNLPVINGASKLDNVKLMNGKMIVIKTFGAPQVIKAHNGEKIIDGGVNSVKIELGGRRNLLAVGKNWITI